MVYCWGGFCMVFFEIINICTPDLTGCGVCNVVNICSVLATVIAAFILIGLIAIYLFFGGNSRKKRDDEL